eukprot:6327483-Prymnesium_polylepis.1
MVMHLGERLMKYDELVNTGRPTLLSPVDLVQRVLVKGKVKLPDKESASSPPVATRGSSMFIRSTAQLLRRGRRVRQSAFSLQR